MVRDARLVPIAVFAWVAAFVGLRLPWQVLAGTALCALLLAAVAAAWARSHASHAYTDQAVHRGASIRKCANESPHLTIVLFLLAACVVAARFGFEAYSVQRGGLQELAQTGLHSVVVGKVTSDPKRSQERFGQQTSTYTLQVYVLEANGRTVENPGQIRILANHPPEHGPTYASIVELSGKLAATNPGERTQALLRVANPAQEIAPPTGMAAATNQLRRGLTQLVEPMSPQARALVPGAAIGDTREMADELDQAMKVSGLTHITAVSGSHFAIIFLLVKALAASLPRVARVGIIAVACVGFVALVHPSGAVLRALAMGLIAVTGLALKRRSQGLAALAFGAIALLLYDPYNASDYGFVLSVVATAGLILGSGPLARFLHKPRGVDPMLPKPMAHALAVPIAAQLAVGPILLFLQPYVSLYSVPANIAAAPALAPATLFGLAATFLVPFAPTAALVCAYIASGATWWIAACAQFFGGLPGAAVPWSEGLGGAVLLTVLSCGLVWWMWAYRTGRLPRRGSVRVRPSGPSHGGDFSKGWRTPLAVRVRFSPATALVTSQNGWLARVGLLGVAVTLVAAVFVQRPHWLPATLGNGGLGQWQVAACDVGQGDAFLARGADGKTYMFDVGQEDHLLRACLRDLAITQVDIVFISHFHTDHYGSLDVLFDEISVGQVVTGPVVGQSAGAAHVFEVAQRHNVPISPWRSTSQAQEEVERAQTQPQLVREVNASWEVIWPTDSEIQLLDRMAQAGGNVMNDASLTVAVELHGGGRAVFLGDLEEAGQERLARHLLATGGEGHNAEDLQIAIQHQPEGEHLQHDREVMRSNVTTQVGEVGEWEGIVGNQKYDVVKMAHHGSASQSAALARILSPQVTVIGVGADNSYGHPSRRALDLYVQAGSHILTTAECGTFGVHRQAERWFVVGGCL